MQRKQVLKSSGCTSSSHHPCSTSYPNNVIRTEMKDVFVSLFNSECLFRQPDIYTQTFYRLPILAPHFIKTLL